MHNHNNKVSIIIPAKNEGEHIARLIYSIDKLNYDRENIEVILVDNGSTDDTASIASQLNVRVYNKLNTNVGGLRNYGVSKSHGEILAFVDADCEVKENWLNAAIALLHDEKIGAVGGQCESPQSGNWLEKTWAPYKASETIEVSHLAASSFIIRRSMFQEIGGFDEELTAGEDDELSNRINKNGKKLYNAQECSIVHWGYPKSTIDIIKRQIWHGSNQLDAAENIFEPMLVMTHLFLVDYIIMMFFFLTYPVMGLVFLFLSIWPPLVVSVSKQKNEPEKWDIGLLLSRSVVYYCYFVGRSIGLVINYYCLIRR